MTSIDEDYLLGHEDAELARLEHQAGILAPATEAILRMAGLAPGMRVLDLGTGLGDVAFVAAGIVGPTGEVVGIDQNRSVVARATSRAAQRGLDNVEFEVGDVGTWHDGSRFDAVVGRLILLYEPNAPAFLYPLAFHRANRPTTKAIYANIKARGADYLAAANDLTAARKVALPA